MNAPRDEEDEGGASVGQWLLLIVLLACWLAEGSMLAGG